MFLGGAEGRVWVSCGSLVPFPLLCKVWERCGELGNGRWNHLRPGELCPPESKSLQLVGVLMQNDPFSLSNQLLFTPQLRVLILFVMEVVSEQSSFAWLLMITTCELMNKIQIKNYTGSDSLDVWPQNIEFFFKDLTHTQTYTYVFIHGFFSL